MIAERNITNVSLDRDFLAPTRLSPQPAVFPQTAPLNPPYRPARPAERAMGQRGRSRVVRSARDLQSRKPMTFAVVVASFCVTLASLYVSACARVTAEGLDEGKLKREIRLAQQREDILHSQFSALTLQSGIEARATQMQMEPPTTATTLFLEEHAAVPAVCAVASTVSAPTAPAAASADRQIVP